MNGTNAFFRLSHPTVQRQWSQFSSVKYQMSTIDIAIGLRLESAEWNISFLECIKQRTAPTYMFIVHAKFDWLNNNTCARQRRRRRRLLSILYPYTYLYDVCIAYCNCLCVCVRGKYNSLCIATEAIHLWFYVFYGQNCDRIRGSSIDRIFVCPCVCDGFYIGTCALNYTWIEWVWLR